MKAKSKPVDRAEIRERVERKFRARGAVAFHLLVVAGAGILYAYNLPELWAGRYWRSGFIEFAIFCGLLCGTGALHFIRYYFRHGKGRDWHEKQTRARIHKRLRFADDGEAEEGAELARIQAGEQLKDRRLLWQHLAVFTCISAIFVLGHAGNMPGEPILEWARWRDVVTLFGILGIGLAAHVLRYVFAYGKAASGREARIEAQVERELELARRRAKMRESQPAPQGISAELPAHVLSLEELTAGQRQPQR